MANSKAVKLWFVNIISFGGYGRVKLAGPSSRVSGRRGYVDFLETFFQGSTRMVRIAVHHYHICSFNTALGLHKNQFKKIRYNEIRNWICIFIS